MKNPPDFDAAAFEKHWRATQSESLHSARNWSKADVSRLEWPPKSGEFVVVKDMSARPLWFKIGAARYFLKREWRALQALNGIEGVPQALARLSPDVLVMSWRAGIAVSKIRQKEGISPESLEKLSLLLEKAHRRGVTHGDLHRENVLIDDLGAVSVIDWATASVFGAQNPGLKTWTQREWMSLDLRAVAKLKARHAPQTLSDAEADLLLHGSKFSSAIRKTGYFLRKLIGRNSPSSPADARRRLERDLAKTRGEQ